MTSELIPGEQPKTEFLLYLFEVKNTQHGSTGIILGGSVKSAVLKQVLVGISLLRHSILLLEVCMT